MEIRSPKRILWGLPNGREKWQHKVKKLGSGHLYRYVNWDAIRQMLEEIAFQLDAVRKRKPKNKKVHKRR